MKDGIFYKVLREDGGKLVSMLDDLAREKRYQSNHKWQYPPLPGSGLFVFESLQAAKTMASKKNVEWIFECYGSNPIDLPAIAQDWEDEDDLFWFWKNFNWKTLSWFGEGLFVPILEPLNGARVVTRVKLIGPVLLQFPECDWLEPLSVDLARIKWKES